MLLNLGRCCNSAGRAMFVHVWSFQLKWSGFYATNSFKHHQPRIVRPIVGIVAGLCLDVPGVCLHILIKSPSVLNFDVFRGLAPGLYNKTVFVASPTCLPPGTWNVDGCVPAGVCCCVIGQCVNLSFCWDHTLTDTISDSMQARNNSTLGPKQTG